MIDLRNPFSASALSRTLILFLALLAPAGSALVSAADRDGLSVRIDPAYISPNDDGIQDQAFFYPVVTSQVGIQRWRLEVWGKSTHISGDQSFVIDTKPPSVSLVLSTTGIDSSILTGQPLVMTPAVQDSSPIERWQFQILDETGRTVQLFWSTDAVHAVNWYGKDRKTGVLVPQGHYQVAFQAWDAKGRPAFDSPKP